jgi:RNase P subunit RPR2
VITTSLLCWSCARFVPCKTLHADLRHDTLITICKECKAAMRTKKQRRGAIAALRLERGQR